MIHPDSKKIQNEILKNPGDWAKKSCKKCNGRGIVGVQTTQDKYGNPTSRRVFCQCVINKYRSQLEGDTGPKNEPRLLSLEERLNNPSLVDRIGRLNELIEAGQRKLASIDERIAEGAVDLKKRREAEQGRLDELMERWHRVLTEAGIDQEELESLMSEK